MNLKAVQRWVATGVVVSALMLSAQSVFAINYVNEVESANNSPSGAVSFTWGDYATGYLSSSSDADNWKFTTDANQGGRPVTFSLSGFPAGKHYVFNVIDLSTGTRPVGMVSDDQTANGFYFNSFTLKANTTYRILVYGEGPTDYSTTQPYYLIAN